MAENQPHSRLESFHFGLFAMFEVANLRFGRWNLCWVCPGNGIRLSNGGSCETENGGGDAQKRFWRPKVTKAVDLQAAMMPKVTLRRRRRAHSRLRSYVRLLVLIVQSQQSDGEEGWGKGRSLVSLSRRAS